jgi:hypothetical protein
VATVKQKVRAAEGDKNDPDPAKAKPKTTLRGT